MPSFTLVLYLLCAALAAAGLFISGSLSLEKVLHGTLPCGTGGGCATVAAHPLSSPVGVPIAFVGVGVYALLFLLSAHCLLTQNARSRQTLFLASSLAFALSLGLLGVAHWVIQATCWWCVGSAATMGALAVVSYFARRTEGSGLDRASSVVMLACLLVFAGVGTEHMRRQMLADPAAATTRIASEERDRLLDVPPYRLHGVDSAPLNMVVFSDFACPACRHLHKKLKKIEQEQRGRVRIVYRHMPVPTTPGHEQSVPAAALSEVAGEKGRYLEMADLLFENFQDGNQPDLVALAQQFGFAESDLTEDKQRAALERVMGDRELGVKMGINMTPTVIVLGPDGTARPATSRTLDQTLARPEFSRFLRAAPTANGS